MCFGLREDSNRYSSKASCSALRAPRFAVLNMCARREGGARTDLRPRALDELLHRAVAAQLAAIQVRVQLTGQDQVGVRPPPPLRTQIGTRCTYQCTTTI
jgi:hypothetical protein